MVGQPDPINFLVTIGYKLEAILSYTGQNRYRLSRPISQVLYGKVAVIKRVNLATTMECS